MTTDERAPSDERVAKALEIARRHAGHDGDHHKAWVIDQMVRALTGCPMVEMVVSSRGKSFTLETQGSSDEYEGWVAEAKDGEDGPETYEWDEGIPP